MTAANLDALAGKWIMEAQKHKQAARDIDDKTDEEFMMHHEIADTLSRCAQELLCSHGKLQDGQICPTCGCTGNGEG